jgi:hypothetical protein
MLEALARIYKTIPEGASAYHICDILIGAAERMGIQPPLYAPNDIGLVYGEKAVDEPNGYRIKVAKWEPEDE